MELNLENRSINFEGIVTESVISDLRNFLKDLNGDKLTINCTECVDMHAAVIQIIGAYKILNGIEIIFPEEKSAYTMALNGFCACEKDNN